VSTSLQDQLFAAIDGNIAPVDPRTLGLDYVDRIQAAHDDFWRRFCALSSPSQQKHYRQMMIRFLAEARQQVHDYSAKHECSIDEMTDRRRKSMGMDPCLALICFAYKLELPDEVFNHSMVGDIENLAIEISGQHNDVVSYRRERVDLR